ncbi:hypothetical protein AB1L23_19855 [Brevibacillus sp. 179-C1.1 HS]
MKMIGMLMRKPNMRNLDKILRREAGFGSDLLKGMILLGRKVLQEFEKNIL